MRYLLRMPDGQEPEWDLPALDTAFHKGQVDADASVRSEHQDFWYPVAELLGERATRPLVFPCSYCQHMIHSRRIDIGNPVTCPVCQAAEVVPDVRRHRKSRLPKPLSAFERAKRRVFWGGLVFLAGLFPVVYWGLHPRPGYNADRYPLAFTVLVYIGLALLIKNWKTFRRGEQPA